MFLDIISNVTDFIENIQILFTEVLSFLPEEIYTIFLAVLSLCIIFFIYRLVR